MTNAAPTTPTTPTAPTAKEATMNNPPIVDRAALVAHLAELHPRIRTTRRATKNLIADHTVSHLSPFAGHFHEGPPQGRRPGLWTGENVITKPATGAVQALVTASRGRGRPPIGPAIEVRLPADVRDALAKLAATNHRSLAAQARAIIVEALTPRTNP